MFKNKITLVTAAVVLSLFTGCDSSNEVIPKTHVSVLHASANAPKVDVKIDNDTVLTGVDFKQGSNLLELDSGTRKVVVEGILPGGARTPVITADLPLDADTRYTIIAANDVADIEPVIVSAPVVDVPADTVRAQVVHAAAKAPSVDVYVTAPSADINSASPLSALAYKASTDPVEIPNGDYEIRITPEGSKTVLFDSGTISLAGGSDLVIAAVENISDSVPVSLVVLDGDTSSVIYDVNTQAAVRVIHDSPDAPAVDIVVNDNFAAPLVEDLSYPDFTPYVTVPSDTYNIKVAVANSMTSVIDADLTFAKASQTSVYAVNNVASIEPLVLVDDNRSVATEAKVRLVHGAVSAPNVDIYVTGEFDDINNEEPVFTDVPFKADTGYVALAEGTYKVTITVTGTKTIAIDTGALALSAGGVYTAIARDATSSETPGTFGLILLDDFN